MGRTPKPLRLLVTPEMREWPEIKALEAKHHVVHDMPEDGNPWSYDVILGPVCWRMNRKLAQYLEIAVAEARKVRYGSKETQQ